MSFILLRLQRDVPGQHRPDPGGVQGGEVAGGLHGGGEGGLQQVNIQDGDRRELRAETIRVNQGYFSRSSNPCQADHWRETIFQRRESGSSDHF